MNGLGEVEISLQPGHRTQSEIPKILTENPVGFSTKSASLENLICDSVENTQPAELRTNHDQSQSYVPNNISSVPSDISVVITTQPKGGVPNQISKDVPNHISSDISCKLSSDIICPMSNDMQLPSDISKQLLASDITNGELSSDIQLTSDISSLITGDNCPDRTSEQPVGATATIAVTATTTTRAVTATSNITATSNATDDHGVREDGDTICDKPTKSAKLNPNQVISCSFCLHNLKRAKKNNIMDGNKNYDKFEVLVVLWII